jgi:IrrE N-terminal-like domain
MRRNEAWEVVLIRRGAQPAPVSPQERFTIAHELAHYLLLTKTHFRPRRTREYWLGEELCNHFAARLLIPHNVLSEVAEPTTAAELVEGINHIARSTCVTAEPAARALIPMLSTPSAAGSFLLDPLTSTKRLGFRGWWVENIPWWGAGGGRRLAISRDHELAPVLKAMGEMRPNQAIAPSVRGASSTFLRRRRGVLASFAAVLDRS